MKKLVYVILLSLAFTGCKNEAELRTNSNEKKEVAMDKSQKINDFAIIIVITSYSIHYTKLYEFQFDSAKIYDLTIDNLYTYNFGCIARSCFV